jgi:RimJ/RimL family protein N-acetyltransferase
MQAVLSYGFDEMNLHRVEAMIEESVASLHG